MWKVFLMFCGFFLPIHSQEITEVDVFFNTRCPFSRDFIRNQLEPAMQHLGKMVSVNMIPIITSKTKKSNSKWEVICAHGVDECYGNAMAACVFRHAGVNEMQKIHFARCITQNSNQMRTTGSQCATEAGIQWGPIDDCLSNDEGTDILAEFDDETLRFKPHIPAVVYNKVYDPNVSRRAINNFVRETCIQLPNQKPSVCIK